MITQKILHCILAFFYSIFKSEEAAPAPSRHFSRTKRKFEKTKCVFYANDLFSPTFDSDNLYLAQGEREHFVIGSLPQTLHA